MASTVASAGKNSEARRNADSMETNVQVSGPGGPEISAGRTETMSHRASKKRVLIIVENQAVPFDRRVWREACSLRENGYQVTVLCPRRKACARGYEVIDGIRIYRHPSPAEGSTPMGYLWEYGCALVWEFTYTSWIYLRHGFDVIQGCNPPDDIFLVALPFKLLGVKYIFDHHDVNPELYVSKYGKRGGLYKILVGLEKLTYRFSDVVVATNVSYKDLAVKRGGLASENVFVVRNGPERDAFKSVRSNPARKKGKKYLVGYVGNMSVQDGLDILLDVAQHIKNSGRCDIFFTCVGGGTELNKLKKMVEDRDLLDTVHFTGRVSDAELLEVLSTADVCVNPDRPSEMNDISTMIKIMEYMALGKPIVQFDSKEGRFSAQGASLYAGKDDGVPDFAAKIIWLLDKPEERKKMGEFGRKRIEEQLAWEYSVPKLLAAYQKALDGSHQEV
jgi:glycosyltransferase involved in cell wall biosynthesis